MVEFHVFCFLGHEIISYDCTESTTLTMPLDFHKSYKQLLQFERAHLSNAPNSQSKYVLYGNVLMGSGLELFYFSRVLSFQCVFSPQCLNVQHGISYVCREIKYSVYELIHQCLTAPIAIQILIECFCNCMEFSPLRST